MEHTPKKKKKTSASNREMGNCWEGFLNLTNNKLKKAKDINTTESNKGMGTDIWVC